MVFYGVLSHFMLLFCFAYLVFCELRCFVGKLCCFVAESVLSLFTQFGVEKNGAKNCACGEKMTNMRYAHAGPKVDKTFEHWLA